MKNYISKSLLITLCISFLLASCKTEEKENVRVHKPLVGIVVHDYKDSFIQMVYKSIEKNLSSSINTMILDSQDDFYLQKGQINNLIAEGVDLLVVNAVDTQVLDSIIDKAKQQRIPLIFFNRELTAAELNSYSKACYIGTSPADAGIMQGEIIKKMWDTHSIVDKNNDDKIQYLMLQGNPVNQTSLARTEHAIKRANELGVKMEQVKQTYFCNWERDPAKLAIEAAISEGIEDVELIIANNDMMALGAIDALQEIGYNLKNSPANKYIPIIGVDALPETIKAIQDKTMSATIKQDGIELGRVTAQIIENALSGKEYLENTLYSWEKEGRIVYIPFSYVKGRY